MPNASCTGAHIFAPGQRFSGIPATTLTNVFSDLRKLRFLRLRTLPSNLILHVISLLPALRTLDTDFHPVSGSVHYSIKPESMPLLESLTIHASFMEKGAVWGLWQWIEMIAPKCSLRRFTLHSRLSPTEESVPRAFVFFLARIHGEVLTHFQTQSNPISIDDVTYLCDQCPMLQNLLCLIATSSFDSVSLQDSYSYL